MRFEVTFDYLCPFARNAAEAVVTGLDENPAWDVRFRPFSLSQAHTEEGGPPVFDQLEAPGIRALHWGIAIRDHLPEAFPAAHLALFAARHDHGQDIADEAVVQDALVGAGIDVNAVAEMVGSGEPARTLAAEHTEAVDRWAVFGVPTFLMGDEAVFVRFMERDRPDDLARTLELVPWARLNEFKRTRLPR